MQYLRTGGRIPIELPVVIQWKSAQGRTERAKGKTASISSNGVLISAPVRLPAKTQITIAVNLPEKFTKTPLRLVCRARVTPRRPRVPGLSAVIDDYQLRPVRKPK